MSAAKIIKKVRCDRPKYNELAISANAKIIKTFIKTNCSAGPTGPEPCSRVLNDGLPAIAALPSNPSA